MPKRREEEVAAAMEKPSKSRKSPPKWSRSVIKGGMAVTTASFYLKNVAHVIKYVRDVPPRTCRLTQVQMKSVHREVTLALTSLKRPVVVHQLSMKRQKMTRLPSKAEIASCKLAAARRIPELLVLTPEYAISRYKRVLEAREELLAAVLHHHCDGRLYRFREGFHISGANKVLIALRTVCIEDTTPPEAEDIHRAFGVSSLSVEGSNRRRMEARTTGSWRDWLQTVEGGERPLGLGDEAMENGISWGATFGLG
ncbi:hypothetical protein KUCAC02_033701 [Chaenocephalus aceratus]|nr:hypothetical protein KUCAC02_033701 [Chaenocephalus aceratus]